MKTNECVNRELTRLECHEKSCSSINDRLNYLLTIIESKLVHLRGEQPSNDKTDSKEKCYYGVLGELERENDIANSLLDSLSKKVDELNLLI